MSSSGTSARGAAARGPEVALGRVLLLGAGLAAAAAGLPVLLLLAPVAGLEGGLDDGAVPPAYAPHIRAAAASCPGVPAPVLAAQLEQESGWKPNAVSSAGAVGLAQFMPATWAEHGVDGDGDGTADPRNPIDAIYAAARYDCALKLIVRSLAADPVPLVLAAYNAGPGAVLAVGGVPAFQETRDYVERVLSRARIFVAPGGGSADGLTPAAARVKQLVRSQFGVSEFGGLAKDGHTPGSDHYTGRAVDVMLNPIGPANSALGWRIALYLQANARALNITYVIWQGRIWSPGQAAAGWRAYAHPQGRTDPTALHLDHVHVSVS